MNNIYQIRCIHIERQYLWYKLTLLNSINSALRLLRLLLRNVPPIEILAKQDSIAPIEDGGNVYLIPSIHALSPMQYFRDSHIVEQKPHEHLKQLQTCDQLSADRRKTHSRGCKCIVSVHNRMDVIVHEGRPVCESGWIAVTPPNVHQYRSMVVVVEEDDGSLAKNKKHGVEQLHYLGNGEHHPPEGRERDQVPVAPTHGPHESLLQVNVVHTWDNHAGTVQAENSQPDIPEEQRTLQAVGLLVLHKLCANVD